MHTTMAYRSMRNALGSRSKLNKEELQTKTFGPLSIGKWGTKRERSATCLDTKELTHKTPIATRRGIISFQQSEDLQGTQCSYLMTTLIYRSLRNILG